MTAMATPEPESIGLIELLERLKADLLSAPADYVPMFSIDEVMLELKVGQRRSPTRRSVQLGHS